jgi:hypothetical protein
MFNQVQVPVENFDIGADTGTPVDDQSASTHSGRYRKTQGGTTQQQDQRVAAPNHLQSAGRNGADFRPV